MTERLNQLMHRAVDDLAIPPAPPSAELLRHGRAVRRRRRLATAAGTAALVVVAAGVGVAAWPGDGGDDDAPERVAADPSGGLTGPVFAIGTTVYLEGGARSASVDDQAVKSMYYTSAGVLVRHGDNPWSDGGGPMRFSLVAPDATVSPLDVTFEETVPSTDPAQPYLAYAEIVDGVVEVVVLDVRDGSEAARVPLPDVREWGGWVAPPVALDGSRVYVGADDGARVVDWRTGEVATADAVGPGFPDVRGGHAIASQGRGTVVVDAVTGEVLLSIDGPGFPELSPDGRYVLLKGPRPHVYDIATGASVAVPLGGGDGSIGWSPDDQVFVVDGGELTSCGATTGECTTTRPALAVAPGQAESFEDDLKLGGATYES